MSGPRSRLYFAASIQQTVRVPLSLPYLGRIQFAPQRELYFFALYRLLVAGLMAALVFSPLAPLAGEVRGPELAAWVAVSYLVLAVLLLFTGRDPRRLTAIVLGSVSIDILAATLLTHAMPVASAGLAVMLLFNIAAAAMLLRLRYGFGIALLASTATILEYLWSQLDGGSGGRTLAELAMFVTSYVALAFICNQIGHRARSSQALAEQRGEEVANLSEINDMIIRRMRTGVLVVDAQDHVTLANEAALALLGSGEGDSAPENLETVAPELLGRLQRWRNGWREQETPLQLAPDLPDVQPRFVRILAGGDLTLVFLDDTSVVSRRAESLTLSTMGRFSASLAHEIRNPLAAINYAVQLLEESTEIGDADRRLLQIIHQQCQRTNGIVESVLGLARRERARPDHIDLGAFITRFVEDYRLSMPIETDTLEAAATASGVWALVDPRHLLQIVTVLVDNALKYGRLPGQPARVRLMAMRQDGAAALDVFDRGPGIPDTVSAQLFRPFFTTSEHGTGLGLYIARELCKANMARLQHLPVPGGGACFRIILPAAPAPRMH